MYGCERTYGIAHSVQPSRGILKFYKEWKKDRDRTKQL